MQIRIAVDSQWDGPPRVFEASRDNADHRARLVPELAWCRTMAADLEASVPRHEALELLSPVQNDLNFARCDQIVANGEKTAVRRDVIVGEVGVEIVILRRELEQFFR